MKFKVNSAVLSDALKKVVQVVNENHIIPILSCFKILLNENVLTVSATNMETEICSDIEADGYESGAICVNAKTITQYIRSVPEQIILFELTKDQSLKIITNTGEMSLPCINPTHFPNNNKGDIVNEIKIESSVLIEGLEKCKVGIGEGKAGRDWETVIFFNGSDFVSTNGFKLVKVSTGMDIVNGIMIPATTVKYLIPNIEQGAVNISISESHLTVISNLASVSVLLRRGSYVDYWKLIPESFSKKIKCNREGLINATKLVSLFENKNSHVVTFEVDGDKLSVCAEDHEKSLSGREVIPVVGEMPKISFSSIIVRQLFQQLECDEVEINSNDTHLPILARHLNTTILLMPLMLAPNEKIQ